MSKYKFAEQQSTIKSEVDGRINQKQLEEAVSSYFSTADKQQAGHQSVMIFALERMTFHDDNNNYNSDRHPKPLTSKVSTLTVMRIVESWWSQKRWALRLVAVFSVLICSECKAMSCGEQKVNNRPPTKETLIINGRGREKPHLWRFTFQVSREI